jgi:hypothetical protein
MRRIYWHLCRLYIPKGSWDMTSQNRSRTYGSPCRGMRWKDRLGVHGKGNGNMNLQLAFNPRLKRGRNIIMKIVHLNICPWVLTGILWGLPKMYDPRRRSFFAHSGNQFPYFKELTVRYIRVSCNQHSTCHDSEEERRKRSDHHVSYEAWYM